MNRRSFKTYVGLAGWLFVCGITAFFAAQFEPGSWYQAIQKPSWTPPNIVFPIVWGILYVCMAVAAWLVWKDHRFTEGHRPLKWFGLQLVLNAAWSWLFFGRHAISTALAEIALLWLAIVFTIVLFAQKNTIAAWLMAPYLAWVSLALALNAAIWQLN